MSQLLPQLQPCHSPGSKTGPWSHRGTQGLIPLSQGKINTDPLQGKGSRIWPIVMEQKTYRKPWTTSQQQRWESCLSNKSRLSAALPKPCQCHLRGRATNFTPHRADVPGQSTTLSTKYCRERELGEAAASLSHLGGHRPVATPGCGHQQPLSPSSGWSVHECAPGSQSVCDAHLDHNLCVMHTWVTV